jgi:hypothetical protein
MRVAVWTIISLLAALSGCAQDRDRQVSDAAEIQRLARITIPASASNVHCATQDGIDSVAYGRFDLPAADLHLVLANMPANEKVRPFDGYSNVTSHTIRQPWWQPKQVNGPQVVNWSIPGFSVNLYFGEGQEPGIMTLYFFNFTM